MAQWVKNRLRSLERRGFNPHGTVSGLKDPALPQLRLGTQLHLRFSPWPRNFHMLRVQPLFKNKTHPCKRFSSALSTTLLLAPDVWVFHTPSNSSQVSPGPNNLIPTPSSKRKHQILKGPVPGDCLPSTSDANLSSRWFPVLLTTACKIKCSHKPFLGFINLLERLTKLRKSLLTTRAVPHNGC